MTAFVGGVLLLSLLADTERSVQRAWGAAMLIGATGLGFITAGWPGSWIAIGVGHGLVLAASALEWDATRLLAGRPSRPLLVAAIPLVWMAIAPFQPQTEAIAILSLLAAAYAAATVRELCGLRAERLTAMPLLAGAFALDGLTWLARGTVLLLQPEHVDAAGPAGQLVITEALIHVAASPLLVLALLRQRADRAADQRLLALALTDPLTGVGNRRHFDDRIQIEVERARRDGSTLALMLIDVDHLDCPADRFARRRMDDCLREIAFSITHFARRPDDLVARYADTGFAVLLPNTDVAGAVDVGEEIRRAVRDLVIPAHNGNGLVTVSIGVAATPLVPQRKTVHALVGNADRALRDAREDGRDRVRADWGFQAAGRTRAGQTDG